MPLKGSLFLGQSVIAKFEKQGRSGDLDLKAKCDCSSGCVSVPVRLRSSQVLKSRPKDVND